MRQIGKVTALKKDGAYAVISVMRMSACEGCHKADPGMFSEHAGESFPVCHECSMFPTDPTLAVDAENPLGAGVGDRVIIESASSQILGYAAGVFFLPIFLSAVLGMIGGLLFGKTWVICLLAVIGFVGAFLFAKFVLDRHAREHTVYTVVKIL